MFATLGERTFFRCTRCLLTFLAPEHRLSAGQELAHYHTHHNDPADPRYRAFLARVADPLLERLRPGMQGLDYGSGPGPAFALMLRERGFEVRNYDPFFAPDPHALERTYHFIACSETAEHFHHPGREFRTLDRLLRPGGWLGVMTELLTDDDAFPTWRYMRDPTHVCFYRPETMHWIAERNGWQLEHPQRNVFLFHKPEARAA